MFYRRLARGFLLVICIRAMQTHGTPSEQCKYNTQLANAIIQRNLEEVSRLILCGADTNSRCQFNYRPLHLAAIHGTRPMLQRLLDNGAEIDATNDLGYTALHQTALAGELTETKYLLDRGADPNIANGNQETPLHLVMEEIIENRQLIEALLYAGADSHLKNKRGTPLAYTIPCKIRPRKRRRIMQSNRNRISSQEQKAREVRAMFIKRGTVLSDEIRSAISRAEALELDAQAQARKRIIYTLLDQSYNVPTVLIQLILEGFVGYEKGYTNSCKLNL